jgi:peroxiredoxin Q/BCP
MSFLRTLRFFVALPMAVLSAGAASAALEVGETAPDFTLPATDGTQTALSSYRGEKTVVLAFFPKAFTAG